MNYDISVIIPFLNEMENLDKLVEELNKYISTLKDKKVEVIFVDDGSTDGSSQKLQELQHIHYAPVIIRLSKNFGSHAALRAGILHAKGQCITFMPADLQDPLELIEQLYEKCREGNDIVWAARKHVKVSLSEKLFSRIYAGLMRRFAISNYPPHGFDIVMFNEKIKERLNNHIEGNSSIFLQILSFGFKNTSITYDKKERTAGKSKWTFSKKIKLFIDSFVAFSYAPIRLITTTGIAMAILGFIWAIYIIVRTILKGDLNPGWPSLISILMFGFGITNISLGIIAEYLWRTLDVSRGRQVFIIDEMINIKSLPDSLPAITQKEAL